MAKSSVFPLLMGAAVLGGLGWLARQPRKTNTVPDHPSSDVIFSMMGLRAVPKGFEGWRLIEWPGEGAGHPSWAALAQRLRSGDGRLLPALRRLYSVDESARIGVVGFSAGSNSGVREMLRSPADRASYAFVLAIDGLHASIKPGSRWREDDPVSWFWSFREQVEPFAAMAAEAAQGRGIFVQTASRVAAPNPQLSSTEQGVNAISVYLSQRGLNEYRELPTSFEDLEKLEYGGIVSGDAGRYLSCVLGGSDAAAHVYQSRVVTPLALEWVRTRLTGVGA